MQPPTGAAAVPSADGEDLVVREEALLIELGDETLLTMRTPGDDADLAVGFLLSEGILGSPDDVAGVELIARGERPVDTARVLLAPGRLPLPQGRERMARAHAVRPSCGLCGLISPEGLTRHLRPLQPGTPRLTLARLESLSATMRGAQRLFQATGGCHAAGVFDARSGMLWAVREDVGRHNALDKALGACARAGRDLTQAAVLLSGRAGYELVLKALRLGVPVVASISAPTSLAVELAVEHGQTLVGFLRQGRGRVYADDGRVVSE